LLATHAVEDLTLIGAMIVTVAALSRAEGMNVPSLVIHAVPEGEKAVEALES
jgi:hypothetical protein